MLRFIKKLGMGEKGQALPIVLALLAVGSLVIAVNLGYATTSLKGTGAIGEDVKGNYAAGAGVENVLWALKKRSALPTTLSPNINLMNVTMTTANMGTRIFYFGGLTQPYGTHPNDLSITGNLSSAGGDRYVYTITVTSHKSGSIHLAEVGARIPVGYTYDDSAAPATGYTLDKTQDSAQAWMLRFQFTGAGYKLSSKGDSFVLTFYITGTADLEGEYVWTIANPAGYGLYGEISGTQYQITSTSARLADNTTMAKIVADLIEQNDGSINILSWQITK